jgi:hypothetical protein
MTTWYLKDARGNEVGPLSREVAVDLMRSRPGVFLHASHDRVTWQPVRGAAVQAIVTSEAPGARQAREQAEAQRAMLELDRFQELAPHHLFGVPKTANARDFRQGFLTLAKRYHPGRLPRDASPELVKANMAVYQFLTERIQQVEAQLASAVFDARPPSPSAPRPVGPSTLPTWQLDVLRLRQEPHQVTAAFSVTRQTAFVFSAHRLMNLTTSSVFFPIIPPLALGTRLGLTFDFEEANRRIGTRGAVALESATADQTLRGFGVRLDLTAEDKGFMLRESQRLMSAPR